MKGNEAGSSFVLPLCCEVQSDPAQYSSAQFGSVQSTCSRQPRNVKVDPQDDKDEAF